LGIQQAEAAYYARRQVLNVLTDLLDQETGLRGYIVTKQVSFLGPYTSGSSRITTDFRLAREAAGPADASAIEAPLQSAQSLYAKWLDGIARPLATHPDRRDALALQAKGRMLMDGMRADVAHALDVLDVKTASYALRTQAQFTLGAILGVVIGLALCAAILVMLRAQRRLEGERDRFVDTAQDLFTLSRMDGHFISLNPAAERILSRTRAELLTKPILSFVHPDDLARTVEAMKALKGGRSIAGFRNRFQAADGTYRWLVWNFVPDVKRGLVFGSARDETERVAFEIEREHLAFNDVVTGLPNRASFLAQTARALQAAGTAKTEVIIILFDLDGFKAVNDMHGHSAGDEVLRELARRVRSALRDGDLVARIGGDEFTVLLQAQVGALDVDIVVGKIRGTFREPLHFQSHELQISASIGVARYPRDGETTDALLAHADEAMYRAKRMSGAVLVKGGPQDRAN
jgi:diguanylate cyclase (GGDEF)-like protein/PAS domain S-box-containing protein